jgi:sterol desaturase/sphingolipid hydroxylase (fatty acid hydroxylase superfamily)
VSPLILIPSLAFLVLLAGERLATRLDSNGGHGVWDWIIHLSGFVIQGAVTPLCGYIIATALLPAWLPHGAGVLPLGWWGAFLLNFVFVDFLYYWQHRAFHRVDWLWKLHLCHHTAKRVDVWVTSRNALVFHFMFVYVLFNPVLGYLVTRPDAFFAGAMLTASLDLLRHANIDAAKVPGLARLPAQRGLALWLSKVLVLPSAHHRHHGAKDFEGNYGANLIVWDLLFGTYLRAEGYPAAYGVRQAPALSVQWLFPLSRRLPNSHAP